MTKNTKGKQQSTKSNKNNKRQKIQQTKKKRASFGGWSRTAHVRTGLVCGKSWSESEDDGK